MARHNPAHYALELAAAGNQAIEQPRMHQTIPHTHTRVLHIICKFSMSESRKLADE